MTRNTVLSLPLLAGISPSRYFELRKCALRVIFSAGKVPFALPVSPTARVGLIAHGVLRYAAAYGGASGDVAQRIDAEWRRLVAKEEAEMARCPRDPFAKLFLPIAAHASDYELKRRLTIGKAIGLAVTQCGGRAGPVPSATMPHTGAEQRYATADGMLCGQVDRIAYEGNRLVITDFKTGALADETVATTARGHAPVVPQYVLQLKFYAYLYYSRTGRWPDTLRLEGLDGASREIPVIPDECASLAQAAREALAGINRDIGAVNLGKSDATILAGTVGPEVCAWCPYRPICPAFRGKLESAHITDASGQIDLCGEVEDRGKDSRGNSWLRLRVGSRAVTLTTIDPKRAGVTEVQSLERADRISAFSLIGRNTEGVTLRAGPFTRILKF